MDVDPTLLPKAFSQTESMGRVIPPLDDMADVWSRHDAAAEPLTLRDGYDLALYETDLGLLKAAYTAYGVADNDLKQARSRRNATQDAIRPVLVGYRKRIAAEFAEGSVIYETLPAYSAPSKRPAPSPAPTTRRRNAPSWPGPR